MNSRCPSSQFLFRAYLENYRFVYDGYSRKRKGSVGNIVYDFGKRVWGAVYKLNQRDMKQLDIYEGVKSGHYVRKILSAINDNGHIIDVNVYIRKQEISALPSAEYRETVVKGAIETDLPVDYIENTLK